MLEILRVFRFQGILHTIKTVFRSKIAFAYHDFRRELRAWLALFNFSWLLRLFKFFSCLLRLFRFSVGFWDFSGFPVGFWDFFRFSVGFWDFSGFQLAFGIVQFQLVFRLFKFFSWLLRFFRFSVGFWVFFGFQTHAMASPQGWASDKIYSLILI